MAELVYALVSEASEEIHVSSNLICCTNKEESALIQYKFCFKAFLYQNIGVEVPELIVE